MKLKTFIAISVVFYTLFLWANFASWNRAHLIEEEVVLGKGVWQKYNCISCHTLFGNGGYVGEDLTHITVKRSRKELLAFFSAPPVLPPNKKKRHPSLSEEESKNIISYFEYLDNIPTLGWPPVPKTREGQEGL